MPLLFFECEALADLNNFWLATSANAARSYSKNNSGTFYMYHCVH